jgi:transposase
MAGKDIIMATQKELKRLHVIHKVMEGQITQAEAASITGLSDRQIRRIVKRIREGGDNGIVHKSRDRASNRQKPQKFKDRLIELYRQKYMGFGPTLAAEKLSEHERIDINDETLRLWLIEAGLWEKKRKHKTHRQWRPRKEHCGEMVQMDGSRHKWFEDRGAECVLMAYIDDTTNKVYFRFYEYEGTIPAMDSFLRYIRRYGIPMSIYFDRHTTYKSTAEPTIEEEINGEEPLSEFGRALKELGVEIIHAYSPQAKGRIERLFGTLQDRLVKEFRLRGISTIQDANKFLDSHYLREFNRKFSIKASNKGNLHRPIPEGTDLKKILCIRTERTVRNDFTISHNGKLYQIAEAVTSKKITVEEHIDGTTKIIHNGKTVKFHMIQQRPEIKPKEQKKKRRRPTTNIPSIDHPWRKTYRKTAVKTNNPPLEAAA